MNRLWGPIISICAVLLLFGSFELGARLAGVEKLSFLDRTTLVNEAQLNPDDAKERCQPRFDRALRRLPTVSKVFALGGSSVFGCCGLFPHEVFPALLDDEFAKKNEFIVENYSLSGRDSFYQRDCVNLLVKAGERPKYWIFYAGHNDFINATIGNPGKSFFLQKFPVAFRISAWALRHLHFPGLLGGHITGGQPILPEKKFRENKERIFLQFQANFRELYDRLAVGDSKLVLVTLVSNLEHRPLLSYLPQVEPIAEKRAEWLFERGLKWKAEGKFSAALASLKEARDWDLSVWRAPSEMNEFFRQFAREHPDRVVLWDLERELDEFFPREGLNCNFFGEPGGYCDFLHPNRRLHRYMAKRLAEVIRQAEQK